jgi:hypothetical protein
MIYTCKSCQKEYSVYASYYSHVKTKHEAPKLVCTVCRVRFHSYTQLHAHAFKLHRETTTAVAPLTALLPQQPQPTIRNKLEDMLAFK